jgi:hypothetical protein
MAKFLPYDAKLFIVGVNPTLLVDNEDRVFGALVGQPAEPTWGIRCMELYRLMEQDGERVASLPHRNHFHRRGKYPTMGTLLLLLVTNTFIACFIIGTGVTFAPGDKRAHNLHLTKEEERLIYRISENRWKIKSDIRKFAECKSYSSAL